MLCYKDRCYCGNKNCPKFKECKESSYAAFEEKRKSKDPFIRNEIGVAIRTSRKCMITGKSYSIKAFEIYRGDDYQGLAFAATVGEAKSLMYRELKEDGVKYTDLWGKRAYWADDIKSEARSILKGRRNCLGGK